MEEGMSLLSVIKDSFALKEVDVRAYSPLTLAYIGDDVYDVIIRTVVVERANRSAHMLHEISSTYVKAQTQAKLADAMQDMLTEEEEAVYRRGRNAKSYTTAKNASVSDYRKATGLEALVGYLYLTEQTPRAVRLVRDALAAVGTKI